MRTAQPAQPIPNLPLLKKVIKFIEANPDAHNQSDWGFESYLNPSESSPCGTAMCVSGWAVYFNDPENFSINIHKFAYGQDALGITDAEADSLFRATNSMEDIKLAAKTIAHRANTQTHHQP